jgi:hypothetical protein
MSKTVEEQLKEMQEQLAQKEKSLLEASQILSEQALKISHLESGTSHSIPLCEVSGKQYEVLSGMYDIGSRSYLNAKELSERQELLVELIKIESDILREYKSN